MPLTFPLFLILGLALFVIWIVSGLALLRGIRKKSKALKALSLVAFAPLSILFLLAVFDLVKDQLPMNASTADVSGTWQYMAEYEKTIVMLSLKANGTFVQTITPASTPQLRQAGHWTLEYCWINFDGLLMYEGEQWVAKPTAFKIYRSSLIGANYGIRGGESGDPDGWDCLKRVEGESNK